MAAMAKVSMQMIDVLRAVAEKIRRSSEYQWGHMGACNCGFVAQEVTRWNKAEIHRSAMTGHGDWSEQLNDYCPTSGLPMDNLIAALLEFGFTVEDLKHLERLTDPAITGQLPENHPPLKHNHKEDVAVYLLTWANILEDRLIAKISIEEWDPTPVS